MSYELEFFLINQEILLSHYLLLFLLMRKLEYLMKKSSLLMSLHGKIRKAVRSFDVLGKGLESSERIRILFLFVILIFSLDIGRQNFLYSLLPDEFVHNYLESLYYRKLIFHLFGILC